MENIVRKDNEGRLHCDVGPAVIVFDGWRGWYKHGKRHREDGPAIIKPDGTGLFYLDNKLITDDPLVWFAMGRAINE